MKDESAWQPTCDLKYLRLRAQMLAEIRDFFKQRSVVEVETPLMCQATGTDPQLDSFSSLYHFSPKDRQMFLQTSPEFAMKRLLAAGSGSIFQICKAFRNGEFGRFHNPEFSILEWYRVGFSLPQLMDEVAELLLKVLNVKYKADDIYKVEYIELFERVTGLNPLVFCQQSYQSYAENNAIADAINLCGDDHSMWLDFIFSYKVQPTLADQSIYMVYGYPAIQSSLARINQQNSAVADRFEVFVNGIEIGNGFFELSDAVEQEKRFDKENKQRQGKGLVLVDKDELFLSSLRAGLPDCSGIAIGLDRLLMAVTGSSSVREVIAFPFDRA
ncbi:MAG: EF-P lysine aminoacylase GenX [Methylococcales bacterium]|nr:EF-P lysine aminoacylase GenX [Methylococcales bacterium]